jgi:hypothetical protein
MKILCPECGCPDKIPMRRGGFSLTCAGLGWLLLGPLGLLGGFYASRNVDLVCTNCGTQYIVQDNTDTKSHWLIALIVVILFLIFIFLITYFNHPTHNNDNANYKIIPHCSSVPSFGKETIPKKATKDISYIEFNDINTSSIPCPIFKSKAYRLWDIKNQKSKIKAKVILYSDYSIELQQEDETILKVDISDLGEKDTLYLETLKVKFGV